MIIDSLLIINKFGGLIYQQNSNETHTKSMVTASTIYSLFEITNSCFNKSDFFQFIEFEKKAIAIFKTLSNVCFIFFCDKNTYIFIKGIFHDIYNHFCDTVLIDPLYNLNMPIKNQKFQPERYINNFK